MAKRKPKYLKTIEGMNACYVGQDTVEDAKKWTESMQCFTNCGDCICFHKNLDENGEWRFTNEKTDDGYCSVWKTMMMETEFCSRGAMNN